MKIQIDLSGDISEDEIIIRCKEVNKTIQKIQQYISDIASSNVTVVYYKENREFYISFEDILFFETNKESVYAHTEDDAYHVKFRLYELEDILPRYFTRISKSAIINTRQILSIERNLTSASLIKFYKTHKQIYVSRSYYGNLKKKLEERILL